MRVLVLHNDYRERGGEDVVARTEVALLRAHGVEVLDAFVDNHDEGGGWLGAARLVWESAWSQASYRRVQDLVQTFRPDVVHVHNFWLRLSPSVHAACAAAGVPTVQTLHNFRLLCANGLFLRDGHACQDCLGHLPWRGAVRGCYRGSVAASAAVVRMVAVNRRRRTWTSDVGAFIALSQYSRDLFVRGGLPADRLFVKPNCVDDAGEPTSVPSASRDIVFVGRLSAEKGVDVLLRAWSRVQAPDARLVIVGSGPEEAALKTQAAALGLPESRLRFTGALSQDGVREVMDGARAVVIPSLWYENFPRTFVEALSRGRATVVSDLGALREVGSPDLALRVEPGDADSLAQALGVLLASGSLADELGQSARATYLARYTPATNVTQLLQIYERAGARRAVASSPAEEVAHVD